MTTKQVVIIGNGRPVQECLSILDAHPRVEVRLVVLEPGTDLAQRRLRAFCTGREFDTLVNDDSVNSSEVVARIGAKAPDFIFSINNFQILRPSLLNLPRDGAINFHNGPIPEYRGVNAPSWAIWNGEQAHGVSWHYMEPEVDRGDLAAAEEFPLTGAETAVALMLRCIEVGVNLFETELDNILNGQKMTVPARGKSRYYYRKQLPNGGILDLTWRYAKISRLLRATDFRPFPNPFTYAKVPINGAELIINELEIEGPNRGQRPGMVVRADGETLIVACHDQLLRVTRAMNARDIETSVGERIRTLGLRPGQQLSASEPMLPE